MTIEEQPLSQADADRLNHEIYTNRRASALVAVLVAVGIVAGLVGAEGVSTRTRLAAIATAMLPFAAVLVFVKFGDRKVKADVENGRKCIEHCEFLEGTRGGKYPEAGSVRTPTTTLRLYDSRSFRDWQPGQVGVVEYGPISRTILNMYPEQSTPIMLNGELPVT
jgi:hypothetical protein